MVRTAILHGLYRQLWYQDMADRKGQAQFHNTPQTCNGAQDNIWKGLATGTFYSQPIETILEVG